MPGPRIRPPAGRRTRLALVAACALVLFAAGLLVATRDDGERPSVGSTVEVATVPPVVGLRTAGAAAALRRAGLASVVERKASAHPAGTVIAAKPKAGSRVELGVAILLVVSRGRPAGGGTSTSTTATETEPKPPPPPATTTQPAATATVPAETEQQEDTVVVQPEPALAEVPGVLEIGFVDSARTIEAGGFVAETYPVASKRPRGIVLRQEPAPGTRMSSGRTVRLYVAVGAGSRGTVVVGDHTGLPERQARDLLQRAGFTVRMVERAAPSEDLVGVVLEQRPGGGSKLPVLTQITLVVGR